MADVKNSYETVFILSTKLGEEGIKSTVQKFKDLIAEHATIDNVDEWGKRRLAYPINKEEEGYYTLIAFTSSAEFTAELDRVYNITDGVLRSLIVRKETPEEKKPEEKKPEEKKEA
ncbi:MAG: 30S ribosomal protein S6 [Oscillospiraceae bacterium]|jgi:small subunit ribosomal protein S6|nr:30S ribosomal protein S6 [Oscillospiraceae bacterium]